MWQFIPETANVRVDDRAPGRFQKPDPEDDRHNWEKATRAAARYIKDIYATDAQASGLLVMASYNWGEGRVIKLLRRCRPTRGSATSGRCSSGTATGYRRKPTITCSRLSPRR